MVTVTLSFVGILLGLPLGLRPRADPHGRTFRSLAWVVAVYVSVLRATPLVTLLLLLFFALPNIGVPIDPDLGRHPRAGHEHLGLQLRGLARRR